MAPTLAIALLLLTAYLSSAGMPGPPLTTELRKTEDSAAITSTQNTSVVKITSKSGIGEAKLVRAAGQWPVHLVIRLNLKGLESLQMDNGTIRVDSSIKSPLQVPYWKIGRKAQDTDEPDGTLELKITQSDGSIEMVVPKEMMAGNPAAIHLAWIDFYRH